jgi:preprotein translocase subunit YajC
MLISSALAETVAAVPTNAPPPPNAGAMLLWNVGFIAVMVLMFYVLLIRPQKQRYAEHAKMLDDLKRGDKIVLQSGMVAVIDTINAGAPEVVVDLFEGQKARVLRSAIAGKYSEIVK